jgi:hypothetical protein
MYMYMLTYQVNVNLSSKLELSVVLMCSHISHVTHVHVCTKPLYMMIYWHTQMAPFTYVSEPNLEQWCGESVILPVR